MLTVIRFYTFLLLIISDLKKAQIYKVPYRDSPHDEIEILLSSNYLNLLKANEHKQDYHTRKPTMKYSYLKLKIKKYNYVGEDLVIFEKNDKIVSFSSEQGFADNKIAIVYGEENVYFMLHRKYNTTKNIQLQQKKNEYQFLI